MNDNVPTDLKYSESHEWARKDDDGNYTVGVTEHAQSLLGDMVFVELPETGSEVKSGEESGVVESVKAASDIYTPLSGEILSVNDELVDAPELINNEPYEGGWIFRIKPSNEAEEIKQLLTPDAYAAHVENDEH